MAQGHLKGTRGAKKCTRGRLTVRSSEQESELTSGLTKMERLGFDLSRREILQAVAALIIANQIKTPFKDHVPGPDWFIHFRKGHGLSIKTPQFEYAHKKEESPRSRFCCLT
ncbi:hypothetical protein QE152_g12696 [Popillia japonica]|uniref:HTH CENPB-type domain-containing protein n=1 Tax=Popillia japonica TaxID=7064 RepID=A0AAW1LQ73_POPJA